MRSTAVFNMLLFRRHWIIFSKPKPYILLDTALLINYISRPRMMTWLRENWRLYHIRCEIRSEINGIGNVASSWVSSWHSWLYSAISALYWGFFCLLRSCGSLCTTIESLSNDDGGVLSMAKKKPWNWMWLFSYPKFQVVFVHILDEFSWMMFSQRKRVVTA